MSYQEYHGAAEPPPSAAPPSPGNDEESQMADSAKHDDGGPAFPLQTRVKRLSDGKMGTVCPDCMNCCLDDEVPVVYDGTTGFLGTARGGLESLGPENAVPEPDKCGMGQGGDCCIFLTAGPAGFCCERFSSLRWSLVFKNGMTAQRHPAAPYPDCMDAMLAELAKES